MAAILPNLIKKGFAIHLRGISPSFKHKIEIISYHFETLEAFLNAQKVDFESIRFIGGNQMIKLTTKDFEKIESFQKSGLLDLTLSIEQNFIRLLTNHFVNTQLQMIENFNLNELNVNPILAGALNLNNETDLIKYYTYQAISRSIVTSVGFLVQNLLLYASEYVYDAKDDELGEQTKWDLVVDKINEVKAYLEIKSGTNDVNKAQLHHYIHEIELIENQGFKGFIGETYGKRTDKTVSHGLMKQYLPNWESRTLIGKELWCFITNDTDYHYKLVEMLMTTSKEMMANQTFIEKIENKIKPLVVEFQAKYSSYDHFLKSLW